MSAYVSDNDHVTSVEFAIIENQIEEEETTTEVATKMVLDTVTTDTAGGTVTSQFDTTDFANGVYQLLVTATDASGNRSKAERTLFILEEDAPLLLINDEVGLPYGKVFTEMGETTLELRNVVEGQPVVIKYRKGIYTTGQMKYYAETVEDMAFETTERGHYTIYVRTQDRQEFVTYLYVEG